MLFGSVQFWPTEQSPAVASVTRDGDAACMVCHPGPTRGLRQSAHKSLLASADFAERACTVCHGDLTEHVAYQVRPFEHEFVPVPAVDQARCDSCHSDADYLTSAGAHPLGVVRAPELPPDPVGARIRELEIQEQEPGLDWSGLIDFGYRFVHVAGSREEYRSDLDLNPGLRLRSLEVQGSGRNAPFDDVWLTANSIGDPQWDVEAQVSRGERDRGWAGAFEVGGGFRRDRFYYQSGGDYHRVDQTVEVARSNFDVNVSSNLRLFGSFISSSEDGFWLTDRIGNRNVTPQSFITGVESPRQFDGEEAELGLGGDIGSWNWSLAGLYRDDRLDEQWTYSQPAQANPSFLASEDFITRSTLRGPGGRLMLAGDFEEVAVDIAVFAFDHDRRISGGGTAEGFDVAQFTTDTTATGSGNAQTWQIDADVSILLTDDLQLGIGGRWRDHQEDMGLQQVDVTTYPTLANTVTVATDIDQHTAQRMFEGQVELDWSITDRLMIGVGYGLAHEWLRVPDLDPLDPSDYVSGYSRDQGVLGDLLWEFGDGWKLRAEVRDFGMDGLVLNDLVPQSTQQAGGSLGWQDGGDRVEVFVRHRRNESSISSYHLDNQSVGLNAGLQADYLQFWTSYTFSQIDSRVLTNFYFDPDPLPVPTFVGYEGDTHTVVGNLRVVPSEELFWEFAAAYTTTNGSYDVSLLDWHVDMRWRVLSGPDVQGDIGLEYRRLSYTEELSIADWDADLLFLYWRSTW